MILALCSVHQQPSQYHKIDLYNATTKAAVLYSLLRSKTAECASQTEFSVCNWNEAVEMQAGLSHRLRLVEANEIHQKLTSL